MREDVRKCPDKVKGPEMIGDRLVEQDLERGLEFFVPRSKDYQNGNSRQNPEPVGQIGKGGLFSTDVSRRGIQEAGAGIERIAAGRLGRKRVGGRKKETARGKVLPAHPSIRNRFVQRVQKIMENYHMQLKICRQLGKAFQHYDFLGRGITQDRRAQEWNDIDVFLGVMSSALEAASGGRFASRHPTTRFQPDGRPLAAGPAARFPRQVER